MRERDVEEFKKSNAKVGSKNVVYAQYKHDDRLNVFRECNPPPSTLFQGLGFDDDPEDKRRHYRRFYPDELEEVTDLMPVPTPFMQYDLKKGQSRGAAKSWFSWGAPKKTDESGAVNTEQVMGRFKGLVTIFSEQGKKDYYDRKNGLIHDLKVNLNELSVKILNKPFSFDFDKLETMEGRFKFQDEITKMGAGHINIAKHIADLESEDMLKKNLMGETKCIVRLYMVSGYDLASRDNGSFSDPYLKISCGKKRFNERENYLEDNPNPGFHKSYDFEAVFPGCPPIVIEAMDYDLIFGDDLIGVTKIDVEDRFFSPEWQSLKNKPIEYRQLYH